jgi:hypothetical protein
MPRQPVQDYAVEIASYGPKYIHHPAIGNIQLSRVSGNRALVDSESMHQRYVRLEIQTGSLVDLGDGLRRPSTAGGKDLVQVYMTEAQWAHFVSSFSDGSGTACTLDHYRDGERYLPPQVPDPKGFGADLSKQVDEHAHNLDASYDRMESEVLEVLEKYVPKTKRDSVMSTVKAMRQAHKPAAKWLRTCMTEVAEGFVARAKLEVEAKAQAVIHTLGLKALAAEQKQLTAGKEEAPDSCVPHFP